MTVNNDYSFDSIRTELKENTESAVFFSTAEEKFTDINLDTSLREQVSANTANIAKHEIFISANEDISEQVDELSAKIETFNNLSYVVHDDFDGNISNMDDIDDLEKIVNDLKQVVYSLVRDYGSHLNTGDLKYQNQLATETLDELRSFVEENRENVLPIRDIIAEVKDSRETFYNNEIKTSLKERLNYDFSIITQRLQDLSEFEEVKELIQTMQNQINDIIENGVRQDIIDDIYTEIEAIKKDIEWLKENGGGGPIGPTPETDLPDGNIIQQCLNVFLITNTTLFRMRSVVEENQGLIDYICFQISQGNLSQEKVFQCYPYLEDKIREKLIGTAIEVYNIRREAIDNMTTPQLVSEYSDAIIEETTVEMLNRVIQESLNVFIKTNSTAVRSRSVLDEEKNLVEYIVQQIVAGRMDYAEVANDYPHLAEDIYQKFMEIGGE